MGTQEKIDRVRKLFSRWMAEIKFHNAEVFLDINKVGEDIARQLLNQIYNNNLQNLNDIKKNFPGVDLGDLEKGIAFQVTSQKKAKKILVSIEKFVDHHLYKQFPQGIHFLLLNDSKKPQKFTFKKKKGWTYEQKQVFEQIANGFDAENRIINCTDLIKEIKKIYWGDENKFQSIVDILEREFGDEKEKGIPIAERLLKGSLKHHGYLTGPSGRFNRLKIASPILSRPEHQKKETWMRQGVIQEGEKKYKETIIQWVARLWDKSYKHTVIVGEGGMGKTVSLLRLWETLLEGCRKGQKVPVPVFIPLNEYNRPQERKDFIVSMIINHYLEEAVSKAEVRKMLRAPQAIEGGTIPSVVLLLDGFNEITVEKKDLLIEINKLIEEFQGVQLVLTNRFDMRSLHNWDGFHLLQLQKLEDMDINAYLEEKHITCPKGGSLKKLVSNPMMLTIYAASCDVVEEYQDKVQYDFKREVETAGELLWNFIEAQVVRLPDRLAWDKEQIVHYRFLLKFLLPALGYEMEKAGLFSFSLEQLNGYVDEYCQRFGLDDFFEVFPQYEDIEESLPLGACETGKAKRKRQRYLREILVEKLGMLVVEEDDAYGFLHQDFRDYFAAVHMLNELAMGVKKKVVPALLRERTLSFFVRRFMGEIEGEHRLQPYLIKEQGWHIKENEESLLVKVLDLCRGDFSGDMGVAVWNIAETWKVVREELSGADLSRLDLSKVNFNSVVCSRSYKDKYLSAQFSESLLHASNLFPQGHKGSIYSAVYDNNCNKILSASHDETIKEWDATTGICLRTLRGHKNIVWTALYSTSGKKILSSSNDKTIKEWDTGTSNGLNTLTGHKSTINGAVYNPKEEKILSVSFDGTIKEWDAATGKCLRTLKGHMKRVWSAVYSGDGKKILSASDDGNIKEWDTAAGQCLRTFEGHSGSVYCAMYSRDEKKILSASTDQTIKEWDVSTGECIRTIAGHTDGVVSAVYSPKGRKILSASADGTINEWDATTGKCLRTLKEHTKRVWSAVYNREGKKILSASDDGTIKEWDTATGQCIKTLKGHASEVTSAVYSRYGKKILSASDDQTIKEWDAATGKCVKILKGHTDRVQRAWYSDDGEQIYSFSSDDGIFKWNAHSGEFLQDIKFKPDKDKPSMPLKEKTRQGTNQLEICRNEIIIKNESTDENIKTLINIPGLWIQGCSFAKLHPNCKFSDVELKHLEMYGAVIAEIENVDGSL